MYVVNLLTRCLKFASLADGQQKSWSVKLIINMYNTNLLLGYPATHHCAAIDFSSLLMTVTDKENRHKPLDQHIYIGQCRV